MEGQGQQGRPRRRGVNGLWLPTLIALSIIPFPIASYRLFSCVRLPTAFFPSDVDYNHATPKYEWCLYSLRT